MRCRSLLLNLGCILLLAPLGMIAVLVGLHWLGWLNAWQFPLIPVAKFCIFGGLGCLGLAWVMQRDRLQWQGFRWPRQWQKQWCIGLLITFLCANLPLYLLAYHVTQVRSPGQLSLGRPRPSNTITPSDRGLAYTTQTIALSPSQHLETWEISSPVNSKGTILAFSGNLSVKSHLLAQTEYFVSLGFDVILTDFQGVGGSTGQTITVGINEAQDVATVFNHFKTNQFSQEHSHFPLILYGVSMGSSAILRAIALHQISPDAIILEQPFARLIDGVKSRLRYRQIPAFPTAELLLFWASLQRGINGFGHHPIEFARAVRCPALVFQGANDNWTTVSEVEAIVENFTEKKELVVFPTAGHQQLMSVDGDLWRSAVANFLNELK
ncbi:MAG: alpha/beta hydrolase [Spirulina sp. SIO3F2]|nr:alpha/beta hydrolase [Spirulina sp. SIO3F2]